MTERPTYEEVMQLLERATERGTVSRCEVLLLSRGLEHIISLDGDPWISDWDGDIQLQSATGRPLSSFTLRPRDYMQTCYSEYTDNTVIYLYADSKDFDATITFYYKETK